MIINVSERILTAFSSPDWIEVEKKMDEYAAGRTMVDVDSQVWSAWDKVEDHLQSLHERRKK